VTADRNWLHLVEQEVEVSEVRHRCRRRCNGVRRCEAGHGEREHHEQRSEPAGKGHLNS